MPHDGAMRTTALMAAFNPEQSPPPVSSPVRKVLDPFRDHVDRPTWAFVDTDAAALAEVVVELVAERWTELDHRVVRAHPVAVVALEAISARQAPSSLEE